MNILLSDFDGTLYRDGGINQKDISAIRDFQQAGNLFGICTGRPLKGIIDFITKDVSLDFYIVDTGASILTKEFQPIFHREMTVQLADSVVQLAKPEESITSICNDRFYCMNEIYPWIMEGIKIHSFGEMGVDKLNSFSIHVANEERAQVLAAAINQKFGQDCMALQNRTDVDIVPVGCSKGIAVEIIKERYGSELEEIAGIGDSYNDIAMLEKVPHAYTFNDSPQVVKDYADYCVDTVEECIRSFMNR